VVRCGVLGELAGGLGEASMEEGVWLGSLEPPRPINSPNCSGLRPRTAFPAAGLKGSARDEVTAATQASGQKDVAKATCFFHSISIFYRAFLSSEVWRDCLLTPTTLFQ